jgi:hypothetical protein
MSAGLTWLVRPLALNDAHYKHGASQATPLKKTLVPRFDNKIRAIPSIMTRVTKGERYLRLHFSISRIQMKQKVQGAFLAASSPFMREWPMDVHMHI